METDCYKKMRCFQGWSECEVIRMDAGRVGRKNLNSCGYLIRMEQNRRAERISD
jgi:hypothetical protein